ncbi:MAG: carbon-nitrogen hydrolase family protein [Promethearchaeota archaeon]|nr:MAG: carbon-nitrogen hydrolase family protein [Candidatus Lokiarchaeota archaeon]
MKIACIQPKIHDKVKDSFSEIDSLLKNLLNEFEECEIACLPERWSPFFPEITQNIQKERGEYYFFLKELASRYNINLLSGAIWEKRDTLKKPKITCYYFNHKGEEVGRQDKIHLYSYEREHFEPGKELNIFSLNKYRFAILICFDMAFFETPRLAVENGADLLFSPTQIREDGMENWKIYLQARVLENRIPAAACNSIGNVFNRSFLGNSKIISFVNGYFSPSKLKILEAPLASSGFVYADIDLDFPGKLRKVRLNERIEKNEIKVNIIK